MNAFRSWGKLQADFVAAAEAWDMLADQLDRQQAVGVVVVKSTSDPTGVRSTHTGPIHNEKAFQALATK